MSNFLNLPIERAGDDPLEVHPDDECGLITCQHGRVFRKGQPFVRFDARYVHIECLDDMVKELTSLDFLLVLASHVARAPSRHNAGTVRQVITGLHRQLGALQIELEQATADAYARGATDAAIAVADADLGLDMERALPLVAEGLNIDLPSAVAEVDG